MQIIILSLWLFKKLRKFLLHFSNNEFYKDYEGKTIKFMVNL